jgi:hypothetical protein
VLIKGTLIVADNAMIKAFWSAPSVRSVLEAQLQAAEQAVADAAAEVEAQTGNRQQRRQGQAHNRKQKPSSKKGATEIDLMFEVLPHLPHAGQMHVLGEDFAVWGTVAEGALISPTGDLVLKHGNKVAGEWTAVGILDALPFETDEMMTGIEMVRTGMTADNNLSKMVLQLAPIVRQMLGRPLLSYGITPLLVFREISG